MSENDIAKEYGTALFMLACEENKKKEYAEALDTVKALFDGEPQYLELLCSVAIPVSQRLSVLDEAFSKILPEHVLSYLKLLCEKGRMPCFESSLEEYKALLDASEHVSNARITSAVELTDNEKKKLCDKLEKICNEKVNTEYVIDKTLLGGLVIEVDGKVIDGSIRHSLRKVKEVMKA